MTSDAFSRESIDVAAGRVFVRRAGSGPVVLLLHGYPETNLAWRKVGPDLANEFTIVAADLPGYGESILSDAAFDDGRVSKRRCQSRRERALGKEGAKAAARKRRVER